MKKIFIACLFFFFFTSPALADSWQEIPITLPYNTTGTEVIQWYGRDGAEYLAVYEDNNASLGPDEITGTWYLNPMQASRLQYWKYNTITESWDMAPGYSTDNTNIDIGSDWRSRIRNNVAIEYNDYGLGTKDYSHYTDDLSSLSDGSFITDYDWILGTVEIIELPDSGSVTIESQYDLSYNSPINCYINEDCWLWYNYSADVVDRDISLYEYPCVAYSGETCIGWEIGSLIDTQTLEDYPLKQDYFKFASTTATTTTSVDYCLVITDPDEIADNIFACDITINWLEETPLQEYFASYDCDNICEGLSDSTIGDTLLCGIKKSACWAFMPSDSSAVKIAESYALMKKEFPLSVVYDIKNLFDIDNYATSSPALPLIFIEPGGDQTATTSIGNLADVSSLQNSPTYPLYQKFYTLCEYGLYFAFFTIIISLIIL